MIDINSINIISKSIIPDFDDGTTIFIDRERVVLHELNELKIGRFNVVNIPPNLMIMKFQNFIAHFINQIKVQRDMLQYL